MKNYVLINEKAKKLNHFQIAHFNEQLLDKQLNESHKKQQPLLSMLNLARYCQTISSRDNLVELFTLLSPFTDSSLEEYNSFTKPHFKSLEEKMIFLLNKISKNFKDLKLVITEKIDIKKMIIDNWSEKDSLDYGAILNYLYKIRGIINESQLKDIIQNKKYKNKYYMDEDDRALQLLRELVKNEEIDPRLYFNIYGLLNDDLHEKDYSIETKYNNESRIILEKEGYFTWNNAVLQLDLK